jgi:predicted kinase
MLVVQMHGVPGSGKSTVARALAPAIDAVVIDKDVIKSAVLRAGVREEQAGAAAYEVYFDVAAEMVRLGHSVILDNPVFWPRVEEKWLALAKLAGSPLLMIECICADERELRHRLATRDAAESQPREPLDLRRYPGTIEVTRDRLTLDTTRALDAIVEEALAYVRQGVPA